MEKSIVFYGYYSANELDGAISNYDIQLAYLLVVITYFLISLVFMVHKCVTHRKNDVTVLSLKLRENSCVLARQVASENACS